MKSVIIMIKPASSLCDMRCKYCFYADVASVRQVKSYGVMTEETLEGMMLMLGRELLAGDQLQFTFQGGEPTLAGLPFFRKFVTRASALSGVKISYALQTNGLHIDEEWCGFLKKNNFLVGISLDLLPEAHDDVRVDSCGLGTYERVERSIEQMRRAGVDFNVLCTLTSRIAMEPRAVYENIARLGIEYTQFTPCLGELDGDASEHALTPKLFASFYTELFALWLEDYNRGVRRSIKLFDDIVNQMILARPTGCGMDGTCRAQLVVEADGSVYPCDFYCLDEYKLGSICEKTVTELLKSDKVRAFVARSHRQPKLCSTCVYGGFCGGNCKRMQKEMCCDAEADSCGYKDFLDACGETLFSLAQAIKRRFIEGK